MAVSMSVLAGSSGTLIASTYSTFCKFVEMHRVSWLNSIISLTVDGRRPAYLCALPILVIGSAGVASAQTVPFLLFWRFFQAMGASPGSVLGAGVIGDIFMLEERGRAMAFFFAASTLFIHSASFRWFRSFRLVCWDPVSPLLLEVHVLNFLSYNVTYPNLVSTWLFRLDYSLLFMENDAGPPRPYRPDRFHRNLFSFSRNQSTGNKRYRQNESKKWNRFIKIVYIHQSSRVVMPTSQSNHAIDCEFLRVIISLEKRTVINQQSIILTATLTSMFGEVLDQTLEDRQLFRISVP